MQYTGERYVPEIGLPAVSYQHWHRYLFASQFVEGKVVLDIACGAGYGSDLLAGSAYKVIGVDLSEEAIGYAERKYRRPNLKFAVGSAETVPIGKDAIFDVIVSFETIEHLAEENQAAFMGEVKRLLKPDGIFIVSTPNKLVYSDLRDYHNEYHLREFQVSEFEQWLATWFENRDLLGQKIEACSYIGSLGAVRRNLSEYRLEFSETGFRPTNEPRSVLYVVAVCSNRPLAKADASVLVDLSSRLIEEKEERNRNLQKQLTARQRRIDALSSELSAIRGSRSWRLLSLIHRLKGRLFAKD